MYDQTDSRCTPAAPAQRRSQAALKPPQTPTQHALRAAGAALLLRAIAALLTGLALAIWYPRRNPAAAPIWNHDSLNSHTLLEHIARAGDRGASQRYLPDAADHAAFPLYQWLGGATHSVTGLPGWAAASLVSLVAIIAAAAAFAACLHAWSPVASDPTQVSRPVWLWLAFPGAALLGWIAPWSLLCALLTATWLAALHDRRLLAGALAGLAACTHPLGLAALPLVLFEPTRAARTLRAWVALAVAVALPLTTLLARGCERGCLDAPTTLLARLHPLHGLQQLGSDLRHGLGSSVELRAVSSQPYGDALARGMLGLAGLLCIITLCALAPTVARRLGPAPAATCLLIAAALLLVPGPVPYVAAPHLVVAAVPAFAIAGYRAAASDAVFLTVAGISAALWGMVTAGAALWQQLG